MNSKKLILGIVVGGIIGAILVLSLITIFDNKRNSRHDGLKLVTNDSTGNDSKKQQILVYGDYMDLDSTDYLLIPLGMKTLESQENRGLRSKSSDEYNTEEIGNYRSFKYNFYSLDFGNCNNIIFYNKKNDSTHLLLQKPAIISQFYFPYYDKDYTGKKFWFILLGVRENDSNADGYLNSEDAERVYITDLTGTNMVQITPDNTQLIDWHIDIATNNILMKVRYDSNNDQKFNSFDEIDILKTSISVPEQSKKIISDDIKGKIKKILDRIK